MGIIDFTDGSVLPASSLDEMSKQEVLKYATAAARDADAALTAALREGMVCYLDNTNTLCVYSGSAWSTVGPVHGALLGWTPVVVQSATPTLTVSQAHYQRIGRLINYSLVVVLTSSGTAANDITVSLPVAAMAAQPTTTIVGHGALHDTSANADYLFLGMWATTTTMKLKPMADALPGFLGSQSFVAALANGDYISIAGTYAAGADA